jgi:hypothetical protein
LSVIYHRFLRDTAMFEEEEFETETRAGIEARINRLPAATPPPSKTRKSPPGHKPYSPQFSDMAAVSVRRLAWALKVSMPKAVDHMVRLMLAVCQPSAICAACQDTTKCERCAFNQKAAAEQSAPSAWPQRPRFKVVANATILNREHYRRFLWSVIKLRRSLLLSGTSWRWFSRVSKSRTPGLFWFGPACPSVMGSNTAAFSKQKKKRPVMPPIFTRFTKTALFQIRPCPAVSFIYFRRFQNEPF